MPNNLTVRGAGVPEAGSAMSRPSIFDALSDWCNSKIEVSRNTSATNILRSEQQLEEALTALEMARLSGRVQVAEFELRSKVKLLGLLDEFETQQHIVTIRRAVRSMAPDLAAKVIEGVIETERRLARLDAVRSAQLPPAPPIQAALPAASSAKAIEPYYDPKDLENCALRAVNRLGDDSTPERYMDWTEFEEETQRKLPSFAAATVINRTRELRKLIR